MEKPETKIHPQMKEWFSHRDWVFGGTAEIELALKLKHKPSNISRALREAESGKDRSGRPIEKYLEKRKVPQLDGNGAKVVQYRFISNTPPKVLPMFARDDFNVHSIPND